MASGVICEKCDAVIPAEDVNVGEGVAFCRNCGTLSRLSDLVNHVESGMDQSESAVSPAGCSVHDTGLWTQVRCSSRSLAGAGFLLLFTTFWNSIVSVFVCIVIADTLRLIFGSVPSWFPSPSGGGPSFGSGVGGVIFMWLFLTPFILVGFGTAFAALTLLFGHVEVRAQANRGIAFTGIGPIGWKRRFDVSDVRSVRISKTRWQENDQSKDVIEIKCSSGKTVKIGSMLTDERRAWMARKLRELLVV